MKSSGVSRGLWCFARPPALAVILAVAGAGAPSTDVAEAAAPASSAGPGIIAIGQVQQPSVRVVVRGRTYQIEPFVWVDQMPIADPNRGVRASFRVRALDGRPLPADLRLTRVQLVQPGGRSWVFTPRRVSLSGAVAEFASAEGPRWRAGQNLAVAISLSTGGRSAQGVVRGVSVDVTH